MATYKNQINYLGVKILTVCSSEAKRYTLRDNGFLENKNGSFHYETRAFFKQSGQESPQAENHYFRRDR
ncbi:MAG: hypothetical protein U5K84_00195 [Alkalibacterium sp.]|nr:hypothetical protein [Alkalibacterium sp.]